MGASNSKPEKDEALRLCRMRMRFIKQAVDSRYALSAAHLAYVQSLRNVGSDLRRFAEAEIPNELSMSTTSEHDKSPSHSSFASPSPSHMVENSGSPMRNSSPMSPRLSNISYMRASGSTAVTVKLDSSLTHFVDDDSLTFPLPPPPPLPPLDVGSTWDFFDTSSARENCDLLNGQGSHDPVFRNVGNTSKFRGDGVARNDDEDAKHVKVHPLESHSGLGNSEIHDKGSCGHAKNGACSFDGITSDASTNPCISPGIEGKPPLNSQPMNVNGSGKMVDDNASSQKTGSKVDKKESEKVRAEREDPSEFITHRAKDFLSSVKDIEHRFFRAAESGTELSRMLEANKIRLNSSSEKIGRSPPAFLAATCCLRSSVLDHDAAQDMTRVITWNRSVSSASSSSRHPLTSGTKDECDSSSDFIEEFCMISGSHSSTLDRLYAWEKKLYDEVKSSEAIRKEYDKKCFQLRRQFARDMNAQVIDKTRVIVKDLHSQVRVALQAVDSIAKRIEKLRDEELLPQVVELIQGLIRMWKAMLACHHAQYITISLAYQVKNSVSIPRGESYRQVLAHLQNEIGCFASGLAMWVESHRAYVEALNAWLHSCILLPQERTRGRRAPFSPRRAIAPPIFVLCRDWSEKIKSLPSDELSSSIQGVLIELQKFAPTESKQFEPPIDEAPVDGDGEAQKNKRDEKNEGRSNFASLHAALMKMFDRLTKFAEASLKMYEEVKKSSEMAREAYVNGWVRFIT